MSWYYTRDVKYYETDRMGVVHHSNYLRILEDARMDWLGDNITYYPDMEKMGIIIPTVYAQGYFKAFLHFGDVFNVRIKLIGYTGARMKFEYEVRNAESGTLCYSGETAHCFCSDASEGEYHPFSIKHRFPKLHEKFINMLEEAH